MNELILVDTSVWIRYFRGIKNEETDLLDSLIANDLVLLVPVLFQEILQGIASQNEYQKTLGLLESLHQYNDHIKPISILAANIFRLGKKKGLTIRKTNDCLIAAYCIFLEIPLLQYDRDFINIAQYTSLKIHK
jgi:predicted nucleic acid-binding protein